MGRDIHILEYLLAFASVFGISIGQVLLKSGALRISGEEIAPLLVSAINWQLLLGITILGASTLLWIFLLRTMPLSIAYPFMALAFLFVPLLSHFALGESLGAWKLVGGLLIVFGVVLSSR